MTEPELYLGAPVVVPDLAGWRRERMPHLPETAYIEAPLDWVCEGLSPSTKTVDRGPMRRTYATCAITDMRLLDLVACRLEAHVLRNGQWTLHETFDGADEVKSPPFDAVPFPISALWPLDLAPAQT
jgi:Putative restriction endonuclease